MFKIIKKWYFKIYHLFKLLGIFIIIFGLKEKVYALETIPFQSEFKISEESCTNNFMNPTFIFHGRVVNNKTEYTNNSANLSSQLIPITPETTYTINNYNDNRIRGRWISFLSSSNGTTFGLVQENNQTTLPFTFTTPNNAYFMIYTIWFNGEYSDFSNIKVMLNEGSTSMEYEEFSTSCNPPTPPGPIPDVTYSSFLTLYVDRIEYLTEGFTTNPYLLAMIGIILAWVVLELFLKILHLRGGYKK